MWDPWEGGAAFACAETGPEVGNGQREAPSSGCASISIRTPAAFASEQPDVVSLTPACPCDGPAQLGDLHRPFRRAGRAPDHPAAGQSGLLPPAGPVPLELRRAGSGGPWVPSRCAWPGMGCGPSDRRQRMRHRPGPPAPASPGCCGCRCYTSSRGPAFGQGVIPGWPRSDCGRTAAGLCWGRRRRAACGLGPLENGHG